MLSQNLGAMALDFMVDPAEVAGWMLRQVGHHLTLVPVVLFYLPWFSPQFWLPECLPGSGYYRSPLSSSYHLAQPKLDQLDSWILSIWYVGGAMLIRLCFPSRSIVYLVFSKCSVHGVWWRSSGIYQLLTNLDLNFFHQWILYHSPSHCSSSQDPGGSWLLSVRVSEAASLPLPSDMCTLFNFFQTNVARRLWAFTKWPHWCSGCVT